MKSSENLNSQILKNLRIDNSGFFNIVILVAIGIGVLLASGATVYIAQKNRGGEMACTMEAKLCPDGSYVGRTGPNCEFSPCPNATSTIDISDWKTYRNEEYGFEVKYPKDWSARNFEPKFGGLWQIGNHKDVAHGLGVSTAPDALWVDIVLSTKGGCVGTDDFVGENITLSFAKPSIQLNKTICKNNFVITAGLWQSNLNLEKNKKNLDQILSTFKFIPPVSSGQAAGTLIGKMTIGPICPVETYPPDPKCAPTPEMFAARTIVVYKSDKTTKVSETKPDASGNFEVALPAGTYWLKVLPLQQSLGYASINPNPIIINVGATTFVDIDIDTGIR